MTGERGGADPNFEISHLQFLPDAKRRRHTRGRRKRPPLDVAIVGMACRFPGGNDLAGYWSGLLAGRDATGDVPRERWDAVEFCDPSASVAENDRVPCARGGYLEGPVEFDPAAFGIMPVAVDGGEPEQYLVLDAARRALADAGLPEGVPDGRRVEVVVGRGNYFNRGNLTRLQHGRVVAQTLAILRGLHPEWSESDFEAIRADLKATLPPFGPDAIAGQITNATAGRVAGRLNFRGASYVVDAASASALVALDLGARALAERRADLAVVGAVYVQCDVDFPMVFRQLGALSRTGRNRPFAVDADGLVPGEGVGVVVLKRLADAERDGHRIYAVLKGVGLASDGRGPGPAATDARGQVLAMRRAYRRAGFGPATVGLIEGHGLGVPAADRAELEALRAVFPPSSRRALGSASSMIGHAMPASGMAGLIKAALALHHRLIPPTPHAGSPHPLLADERAPARLAASARPWVHGEPSRPRRAAVGAFGFAGIHAHAVLEEHAASADAMTSPGAMPQWDTEAILLGAPDRGTWIELARALVDWIDAGPRGTLKDLAYTLNVGQPAFPFRVGLVAASFDDLKTRLNALIARLGDPSCRSIRDARGAYHWAEPLAGPGRLAFVFPGEGSQYRGMLADLYPHFPEVRVAFDRADRVAVERGHAALPSEALFGSEGESPTGLWSVGTAISLVLSAQWGLLQLLARLGLRPDAVAGHSSGEFLAMAAAGVIRVDRRFEERLAAIGEVFTQLERVGGVPDAGLLAVAADRGRAEAACRAMGVEASVAMDNCPHQVVLALEAEQAGRLAERLRGEGVTCEVLPFTRAYHTTAFASALGPVRDFFRHLPLGRPRLALYSCATAARVPDDPEAIRELAVEQWARPVAFRPMIEVMHDDGLRLFVEVGTRGLLTGFVEDTLRGRPAFAMAANLPRRSGLTQLNHLVASLFAQGVPVRPDHLYLRRRPERVDLAARPAPRRASPGLALGFPEMRLSEALAERLRSRRVRDDGPAEGSGGPRDRHRPSYRKWAAAGSDEAMAAYLETMDEFVAVQREVMAAFLDGPVGGSSARGEDPASAGFVTRPPEREAPMERIGRESASASLEARLMEKVAARTGYPREMLGLDLDLEADLGIDSIKRVEILGDLKAEGLATEGTDLDGLTAARTLRQVLERLSAVVGEVGPEAGVDPGPFLDEVRSLTPGRELVAVRYLRAEGDPVAAHHTLGGRRISEVEPARRGLPVVPFTVMAEMLAEAAALLVPGRVLVGMRDVAAHRWIPYEAEPIALEVRARRDPAEPDEVRVAIFNTGAPVSADRRAKDGPVVEGVIVFGQARPEAPEAAPFEVEGGGPSGYTAERLYGEGWLFHGPPLQALTAVGTSGPRAIEGTIAVRPRGTLRPVGKRGEPLTDAIVLDSFTHLLGCWSLDHLAEGEVVFPLRLAELAFFGDDPREGESVSCRIRVRDVERHRLRADAEIVRPDGRLWMRLGGWEDWRFYWPNAYRDQFRGPDRVFLGEPLTPPGLPAGVVIAWLEPPADFARPIWRDVMEAVQLDPEERAALGALKGPERRRTLRIWGRVAAKEAARRLWAESGGATVYPADLAIVPDRHGRPSLRRRGAAGGEGAPAVSIAHTEGVAVALAARDPSARVGIDVERVVAREEGFEAVAFSDGERALLDRVAGPEADRAEWVARFWCAKEAVGKSTGRGLMIGPASVEVVEADEGGVVAVALGPDLRAACADWPEGPVRASTGRRGAYAWAWTVAEPAGAGR